MLWGCMQYLRGCSDEDVVADAVLRDAPLQPGQPELAARLDATVQPAKVRDGRRLTEGRDGMWGGRDQDGGIRPGYVCELGV